VLRALSSASVNKRSSGYIVDSRSVFIGLYLIRMNILDSKLYVTFSISILLSALLWHYALSVE
jgi:hypothetical protein